MKIALRNNTLIITASREHLAAVRALPDRRWDPESGDWHVPYTIENYQKIAEQKWPIGDIAPPAVSSSRVDLVNKKGTEGVFYAVFVPREFEQACKQIPENRMWSMQNRCWLVRPTAKNTRYLREQLPQLHWSTRAQQKADAVLAAHAHFVAQVEAMSHEKQQASQALAVDVSDFKFKTKPYLHQAKVFKLSRDKTAFALLLEQGTGKTKVTIDTIAWLRARGKIAAAFIVCPNDVKDVWVEEFATHMPDWAEHQLIVDGQLPRSAVDKFVADSANNRVLKIVITNVESLASTQRIAAYKQLLAKYPTMMVLDEATRFKNPTAKRTKAMLLLGKSAAYRRILTGTPVTQNPLDVYAPFRFLDQAILGFNSYAVMRAHHGILGGWQGKQVIGFTGIEELKRKIDPFSYRILRDDCVDLPPKVYQKHLVNLSDEQRKMYDALRDELVAELESGDRITAPHALVKLIRLSQIVGGFVKTDVVIPDHVQPDSHEWHECVAAQQGRLPVRIGSSNPKLTALLEIIEDLPHDGKVVIWARFRAEIELLHSALVGLYGKDSAVTFYGGVDREERTRRRRLFQGAADTPHDPRCRFFIAQVDTGSVGLTLTRAQTVVYFSNSYSLETRLQSEDRTHRIGQTGTVTYHDLIARDTLDVTLVAALRRKKKFADMITGDTWKTWL